MTEKPHFTRDQLKSSTPVVAADGERLVMQVSWPATNSSDRSYLDDRGDRIGLPECFIARSGKAEVQQINDRFYVFENGEPVKPV